MKKARLRADSIFAFFSIISLLYIYYYVTIFYYWPTDVHLFFIYEYLAVPCFYFFLSAFIVTVLCSLAGFSGIPFLQDKSRLLICGAFFIFYIMFAILRKVEVIHILSIFFGTVYCIGYVLFGVIFAFAFYRNK